MTRVLSPLNLSITKQKNSFVEEVSEDRENLFVGLDMRTVYIVL